jgi:hypothetical protein
VVNPKRKYDDMPLIVLTAGHHPMPPPPPSVEMILDAAA